MRYAPAPSALPVRLMFLIRMLAGPGGWVAVRLCPITHYSFRTCVSIIPVFVYTSQYSSYEYSYRKAVLPTAVLSRMEPNLAPSTDDGLSVIQNNLPRSGIILRD